MESCNDLANCGNHPYGDRMASAQREHLSRVLIDERERQTLSRDVLAFRSGVSVQTIRRLEKKETDARPSTLHRLADGLGVDVSELVPTPALDEQRLDRIERKLDEIAGFLEAVDADQFAETVKRLSSVGAAEASAPSPQSQQRHPAASG